MLTKRDKVYIRTQRAVSHCLFVLLGPLMNYLCRYKYRYQVEDLKTIRKQYREMVENAKGPVLVCTNHLTLIDSIIQAVTLKSTPGYLLNFSAMPWNIPEKSNFYHKRSWRMVCYLGKCIPVQRMSGSQNAKKSLAKMSYVLNMGDVISLFPEGTRSRSGRIDDVDFSYGTGELLKDFKEATVICVYMRGRKNGGFADFPEKNQSFYFSLKSFSPVSEQSGLRRVRDLSTQIIQQLKQMELEYFENEQLCRQ